MDYGGAVDVVVDCIGFHLSWRGMGNEDDEFFGSGSVRFRVGGVSELEEEGGWGWDW